MAFAGPPPPKTALGHYRMLAPTASIRVSPLCLGAMNFGDAWKDIMGECDEKTTNEILDFYYESGGNFIDTANNYQVRVPRHSCMPFTNRSHRKRSLRSGLAAGWRRKATATRWLLRPSSPLVRLPEHLALSRAQFVRLLTKDSI